MNEDKPAMSLPPYLAAAVEIGDRLLADAVPQHTGVSWEGDDLIGDDEATCEVVRGPVGPDLYRGSAGIAWFLGHLAAATSSADFAKLSTASLQFALAESFRGLEEGKLSLYTGSVGVALAAAEVGSRLGDPALSGQAHALALQTSHEMLRQRNSPVHDLIGGLAGIAVGLVGLHRHFGDALLLDAARTACKELVDRAEVAWWGRSWPDDPGTPALCGLGHGASGVGWALAETAWATGDASLMDVAQDAFRYETSRFSPQYCAWPDLRRAETPGWTTAWCHGALGIGAVRLRLFEATNQEAALAEASAAIQAARTLVVHCGRDLANGNFSDVSLCHGLGGATELILLANEILGLADHGRAACRIADLCLKIRAANGGRWTNGLRGASDVPGLFLGDAGIGVTMMRVNDPSSIDSPLLAGRRLLGLAGAASNRMEPRS